VLDREMHRRGLFPPIDVLPSLSRLMNAGIGEGKTSPEHREWSDQLYAVYARGREARSMAAILGESGLPVNDRRALAFADQFERAFISQGRLRRSIADTLKAGWQLLDGLPREDLVRLSESTWQRRQAARATLEPQP
jgi:V/A-type H+-transporting ATPase subunit B